MGLLDYSLLKDVINERGQSIIHERKIIGI